jgi:hypothetical protein
MAARLGRPSKRKLGLKSAFFTDDYLTYFLEAGFVGEIKRSRFLCRKDINGAPIYHSGINCLPFLLDAASVSSRVSSAPRPISTAADGLKVNREQA